MLDVNRHHSLSLKSGERSRAEEKWVCCGGTRVKVIVAEGH